MTGKPFNPPSNPRPAQRRRCLAAVLLPAIPLAICGLLLSAVAPAIAQIRVKDIADLEGVRSNQLVGYGLVVGLNGTGGLQQAGQLFERGGTGGGRQGWVDSVGRREGR